MDKPASDINLLDQEIADKMARKYVSRLQAEISQNARDLARNLGTRHDFVTAHGREVAEGAFWAMLWYTAAVLLSNQADFGGSPFIAGVVHHASRYMEGLQGILGGDPIAPMRGLTLTADFRRAGLESSAIWVTAGAILRGSYGISTLRAEHAGLMHEAFGLAREGLRSTCRLVDLKRVELDLLSDPDGQHDS